jgi:hypothetical protein
MQGEFQLLFIWKRICVILKASRDSFVFIGRTTRIFDEEGSMVMPELMIFLKGGL